VSRGRIRVVQLVHGYPPAVGGVELTVRDMCERLVSEYSADVTVLTTDTYTIAGFHDGSLPRIPIVPGEVQNGVRVERFPVKTGLTPVLRQAQRIAYRLRLPGNDWLRTWYNGPIAPAMLAAVKQTPADVICAASFPLNHMLYPFRVPEPQPPVVLIAATHTTEEWGYRRPNLLRLVDRSYATVAHTEHEREWLVRHGAAAERIRVIGHGVDPDDLRPRPGAFRGAQGIQPDDYVVAYVGQQADHKGIETLIDVFPDLLERCPDAWLVVAGARTPYTHEVTRRAHALPPAARARLRIVTDLSHQAKADVLGDCDVFASPSRAESFGITTLEAWALGKPVVVGDAPSQRAVVHEGVNGLIVPYADARALCDALVGLHDDPALRNVLGDAGRRRVLDSFVRRDVERAYCDLLLEAAASKRP
jgi:glycosyltransferase involved in cell wall biosynthesis